MNYEDMESIEGTYVPMFSLLTDYYIKDKEIKEKTEISFQNIIALFEKQEPISVYIERQEGPLIDIDALNSEHLTCNEDGNISVDIKKLDIHDYYCPICGEKIENGHPFNFHKVFETKLEENPYFKKFIIDNKVSFNYIDCKHCIDNITENFRKNGKPLVNSYLKDIYIKLGNHLKLKFDTEINKDKRILFPVDRVLFRDINDQPLYLNLFNIGDLAYSSFYYFFKEYNENNENKIPDELFEYHVNRIFTAKSYNPFDENDERYQIYRSFEEKANDTVQEIIEENDFIKLQLEDFKFQIDPQKWADNDVSDVVCLKDCVNCSKRLSFESKEQLYEYVNKRVSEETCLAKQFLKSEEEEEDEEDDGDTSVETRETVIKDEKEVETVKDTEIPPVFDDEDEEEEAADIIIEDNEEKTSVIEDDNKEIIEKSEENKEAEELKLETKIKQQQEEEKEEEKSEEESKEEQEIELNENHVFDDEPDEEEDFRDMVKEIVQDENKDVEVPIENYDELLDMHIKHLIIRYFYPSEDDIRNIANYISTNQNKPLESINLNDILNVYADFKAEDLYNKVSLMGKEILNSYPGITIEKLKDFIFDLRTTREKEKLEKQELDKARSVVGADVVSIDREENYNIFGTQEVDENMDYLQKIKEKEAAAAMKKQNDTKFAPNIVFHTPDDKSDTIPFIREDSLVEEFNQSVFKPVFDNAMKYAEYKCGKMVVSINRFTNFIPIVDFIDLGIRFVCIDTEDSVNRTFTLNPVKTSFALNFPNNKYRSNYSLNVIYSNECRTRPMQVARHIYKLIGYGKLSEKRVVQLNNGRYPLAYSSEINAMVDFEKYHSIFADNGRVRMGQVTIIAFVEQDRQSVMYQRREMARNQVYGYTSNNLKDLLDNSEMYYVASAHYVFNKLWNTRIENGKEVAEPYILYRITQYTENMYCVVSDGLPAVVSAILKEHDKNYANQNIPCSIIFEYDMTQINSPSVRCLISENAGIFEIDNTSMGQSETATVTSYVISESRFRQPPTDNRNDNCRVDSRMFLSNADTFKKFLMGKIRADIDVTDRKSILLSLGYVPYPEPRPFNYQITNYALDELERSTLHNQMFEIELDKLNSLDNQNNYQKVMNDLMVNKFMMQYQQNTDENVGLFAQVLNSVVNIFSSLKK